MPSFFHPPPFISWIFQPSPLLPLLSYSDQCLGLLMWRRRWWYISLPPSFPLLLFKVDLPRCSTTTTNWCDLKEKLGSFPDFFFNSCFFFFANVIRAAKKRKTVQGGVKKFTSLVFFFSNKQTHTHQRKEKIPVYGFLQRTIDFFFCFWIKIGKWWPFP